MHKFHDPQYLRSKQYKDASNLNARQRLHVRFSKNPLGWLRWVFDQLDLPANCQLLELGCGSGDLWRDNADRVPPGWEIILTDFSPGMLEKARGNLEELDSLGVKGQFEFRVVDAQELPFKNEWFDAVIANHMLYHVPDRPRALAEIHRVLKPGGKLFAATNGPTHMQELYALMVRLNPDFSLEDMKISLSFSLENGAEQLSTCFKKVAMQRQANWLEVTEVEPLLAYILSMVIAEDVASQSRLADLEVSLQDEIAAKGAIHITKDAGMFIATK
jgi:ubiquinone/menaquinone biosynthesis C-methylase UbiE